MGKLKESFYAQAVKEYEKRLTPFCKLEIWETPETRLPDRPSASQILAALEKEAAALLPRLEKGGTVVALCIEGEHRSSEALAEQMEAWAVSGVSKLTFVIGGSYGLAPAVKSRADLRLSLSSMTFPHHLARVMLLEQIYRCFQLQNGTQYHK